MSSFVLGSPGASTCWPRGKQNFQEVGTWLVVTGLFSGCLAAINAFLVTTQLDSLHHFPLS